MEIATLFAVLDGTITLTTRIVAAIEESKRKGVILTPEQEAVLDRVNTIRSSVGL
jgi:hypothetical protein